MECSVLEVAGGGQVFLDLARAWHRRCLEDPVVSHVLSDPRQQPQHGQRLAAYGAEAHGGPTIYTDAMLRLHSGNGEQEDMDARAQGCFALALDLDLATTRRTASLDA